MLVYPVPHAVTQARVQLVADQTEKAPSHIIQADVLNVFAAKNAAERQALADFRESQAKEAEIHQERVHEEHVRQDQAQLSQAQPKPAAQNPVQQNRVQRDHVDVKA
jgi:hypothetical protein